jgi:L-amino acid N-acyltransferase YncA
MTTRRAVIADAEEIARIYNEGIEDRVATFETRFRSAADIGKWFDGRYPAVVVEVDGRIIAFAATSGYRPRDCYMGIAEVSLYVERASRRKGAGRAAMLALTEKAGKAGFWKLVSRVFVENRASRALIGTLGFREVGIYGKHGKLDGAWKDVMIVERLIPENLS